MSATALPRSTMYRLVFCILLLAGLLLVGAGVPPTFAQAPAPSSDTASQQYGWVSAGVGGSNTGVGINATAGIPLGHRFFVGGRLGYNRKIELFTSPSESTVDVAPLIGLVGRQGTAQFSIATGLAMVRHRRRGRLPDSPGNCLFCSSTYAANTIATAGIPLDVQAIFALSRRLGLGLHGYTTVIPNKNVYGASLQLQLRLP